MENDSIRAGATTVHVDIWIDGKMRSVSIAHEAIGAIVGYDKVGELSDEERCELVRANLPLFVEAAKARLKERDPAADAVAITGKNVAESGGARAADRRLVDRRKRERRKTAVSKGKVLNGERRRGTDRRQSDRRSKPDPDQG